MTATKIEWTMRETIRGLKYIAASPPPESGGFHPQTVLTAQAALYHIARLRKLAREFPR